MHGVFITVPLVILGGALGWYVAYALCMRFEACKQ